MKKQILTMALISAFNMPVMADFLGVYAGLNYRTTETTIADNNAEFEDRNNLSGYVALEHFIPVLPNVKLKYSDLSSELTATSTELESSAMNAILYYELFDNGLFEFDFGLAYSGLEDIAEQSADIAQAYAAGKVHIPGMGMNLFAEVITGSLTDDDGTDAEMGLTYTFNPDAIFINLSVRVGYRYQEMVINDLTQENQGLFAGLEAHF